MKKFLSGVFALAILLSACQTGGVSENGLEQVKIGVIGPMSGEAAAYGEETKNILDYGLVSLNERAAEMGYEFELLFEDGGCNGSDSSNSLQKLHDVDGVTFVLGGECSSESLGIVPLLEENDMFAVSALSSSPELIDISPRYHSFSYSDDSVGLAAAELMNGYERIAIITEQADWPLAFTTVVEANLDDDTELVLSLAIAEGTTNLRNELQQLKSEDLDAIFFSPNIGTSSAIWAKQIAELGEWDVDKVSQISMLSDEVMGLDTELLNGMIVVDSPRREDAEFEAMVEEITANYGSVSTLGNYYVASTLEALNQLADQIMANEGEIEGVMESFNTGSFDGYYLADTVSFDGGTFVKGMGTAYFVIENGSYALME
jgi:branched-chain amino acid transport system substrate-binding protein